MEKKLRIILASICFTAITLLFLDFTGTVHLWFGWLAKIQFLPALLSNIAIFISLIVLTLIFGRVYCSIICPLGVMQDIISFFAVKRNKNRYTYSPAKNYLRYGVLVIFVVMFILGISSFVALLAPYSSFGRIISSIFAPIYKLANNGLAYLAERFDSYLFYSVDIWVKSIGTLIISIFTISIIGYLAWKHGRTYCNTICPVGTILGFISKFSILKVRFDENKCVNCGLCAKNCKSACIDIKHHVIDYSRCVSCMNCLEKCNKNTLSYSFKNKNTPKAKTTQKQDKKLENKSITEKKSDSNSVLKSSNSISRKDFLSIAGLFAVSKVIHAQDKKIDGGLAFIEQKKVLKRITPIKPHGSKSFANFTLHCTACHLCVSVCPNDILIPSSDLQHFGQPELSYERGYCRPECTLCSEVCPTGAILPISKEEKASTQIGHAIFIKENCVVLTDNVSCGNCSRHCPTGAIQMIPLDKDKQDSALIPIVNTELCIGCGACEHLCPSRPYSSIYVEGHDVHRTI